MPGKGKTFLRRVVDEYIEYRYIEGMDAPATLREPTFLILAALAREDLHGYGILKEVESLSGGRVRLAPGTLYGALERLKQEGLVRVTREERFEGRLRRYYQLTDAGEATLRQEIERQEGLAAIARANLVFRVSVRSQTPVRPRTVEAS